MDIQVICNKGRKKNERVCEGKKTDKTKVSQKK